MNKINYNKLLKQKKIKPITCLTAYTKAMAKILDGKVDLILIGDSLATALYDMRNTQNVSIETMQEHGRAVCKNVKRSMTIIDMPYNSYKNKKQALINAKKLLAYSKANFIKIESNNKNVSILKHLVFNNLNVVGHIGVTPQRFSDFKKIKSVGKNIKEEKYLISLAKNLESAGAKFIILECINKNVAKKITDILKIPTIGIGASKFCDGQVLVINDLLNFDSTEKKPKFVKNYLNIQKIISNAVTKYTKEVKSKKFPSKKYSYN